MHFSLHAAPPNQPSIPMAISSGATWIYIFWTIPLLDESTSPISYYEVIVKEVGSSGVNTVRIITEVTLFNATGLMSGRTYELTVVAVVKSGNITARSIMSAALVTSTDIESIQF